MKSDHNTSSCAFGSGELKNITNLSSAELAQRVVKVKQTGFRLNFLPFSTMEAIFVNCFLSHTPNPFLRRGLFLKERLYS